MLASPSSSAPPAGPLSTPSFEPPPKPPAGWKDLLKTSSPYSDNHHYYGAEYPCRYPGNAPGSPAALQTIITTTTKVSPPAAPSPAASACPSGSARPASHCGPQVSYQPCPKPPSGLPSYQSCAPPKAPGLPSCSTLLDDTSSSYSTEVKVMEESGGVIKSLSFQPEPVPPKSERADGYDYRYSYPSTYRYDDY